MAATEKRNIWFWSSDDGVAPIVKEYPIAATQGIFMPGAPCYITTAGDVKLAATGAGTGQAYHGFIIGLASQSGTWPLTAALATGTKVRVALITNKHLYAVYAETAGTDTVVAQTNVGDVYGLVVSATATQIGYTTANIADATNVAVKVCDIAYNVEPVKFPITANPGVLLVRFLQDNIEKSAS